MKKSIGILALGGFLISGTATAQLGIPLPSLGGVEGGIVGILVTEVVPSLSESLAATSLEPTLNAAAGPGGQSGLAQGDAAVGANLLLTGLLVLPPNPEAAATGGQIVVAGLLNGLARALTGEGVPGGVPGLGDLPLLGDLLGGGLGGGVPGLDSLPLLGDLLGGGLGGGIPGVDGLPVLGDLLGGLGGGAGGLPLSPAILTELLAGLLGGGAGGLPLDPAILTGLLGGGASGLPLDPAILTGLLSGLTGALPGLPQ